MKRALLLVIWLATVVASVGVGRLVAPDEPQDELVTVPTVTAVVERRAVERTVGINGTVAIDTQEVRGPTKGRITEWLVGPGDSVSEGDVLALVDERPLIALAGSIPAYRDVARGDTGRDVAQIQAALARLGYYPGELDGKYGSATEMALTDLYRDHGFEPPMIDRHAVILQGEFTMVPHLPAVVTSLSVPLGSDVAGSVATLAVGPAVIEVAFDPSGIEPPIRFFLPGGPTQLDPGPVVETEEGWRRRYELVDPLPAGTVVTGRVILAAIDDALVLPASAVRSNPAGEPFVVLESGREARIDVLFAGDDGVAFESVDGGVNEGDSVVLYQEAP